MRIAYSCAGEGFGHAARMVALYEDLAQRHDLALFVPATVAPFVSARLGGARLRPLPCFELQKRGNRIVYGTTLLQGLRQAAHFIPAVRRLARTLRRLKIDLVLSDFEPYLPWAARLAGVPVVQLNHPGIVRRFVSADPRSWIAAALALLMEGPWDRRILVSFYAGDVGPVLRKSLLRYPVRDAGFIAVNLKPDARRKVLPLLDALPGLDYRLYPAPGANFDEGLASCRAVISSAGHQTLSEAISLGKPILALPQDGQFEQTLNGRMLEASGRGMACSVGDLERTLPRFLRRLPEFRSPRILPTGFRVRDSRARLLELLEAAFRALAGPATVGKPLSVEDVV